MQPAKGVASRYVFHCVVRVKNQVKLIFGDFGICIDKSLKVRLEAFAFNWDASELLLYSHLVFAGCREVKHFDISRLRHLIRDSHRDSSLNGSVRVKLIFSGATLLDHFFLERQGLSQHMQGLIQFFIGYPRLLLQLGVVDKVAKAGGQAGD